MRLMRNLADFTLCLMLLLLLMAAWGAFGYVTAFDRDDGTSAPMEKLP